MAGGRNIAESITDPSVPTIVDPEWLIEQNPDFIVKTVGRGVSHGYGADDPSEMEAKRNEIMDRLGWSNVNAVKNEKVYLISADIWSDPAYFVSITYMAKWFHPDLFEDLDPKAIHQQYLTEFQGLDYDLDKYGVFVYPPVED